MNKSTRIKYRVKINSESQRVSNDLWWYIIFLVSSYYFSFIFERKITTGNEGDFSILLRISADTFIWLIGGVGVPIFLWQGLKTKGRFGLILLFNVRTIFYILMITKYRDISNLFGLIIFSISPGNGVWPFTMLFILECFSSAIVANALLIKKYLGETVYSIGEDASHEDIKRSLDCRGLTNASIKKRVDMSGCERPLHGMVEKESHYQKDNAL